MKVRLRGWITLAALVAVFALTFGCSSDDGGMGPGTTPGDPITLPLVVGNTWVYQTTTTTPRGPGTIDSTIVTGTQLIDGDLYYLLETREPSFVDSTFVRQSGQELLVRPANSFCTFSGGGIDQWFCDVLDGALPYKFADFGLGAGGQWTIAQAETTVTDGPFSATYEVLIQGTSRGRTTVTVPAGAFSDVYEGDLDFSLTITGAGGRGGGSVESSTQTFWFKDGVGIVKQRNRDTSEGSTTTDVSDLTSYQLN